MRNLLFLQKVGGQLPLLPPPFTYVPAPILKIRNVPFSYTKIILILYPPLENSTTHIVILYSAVVMIFVRMSYF